MNITDFIAKWRKVELTERSAAQQHFLDLCDVFDHPKPAGVDPAGTWFTFEKGAAKHGGGIGTVRYPRLVAKDSTAAAQLAKRTLTNLYNQRPIWLDLAHRALDMVVAAAYGWPADLTPDEILGRLLTLNQQRAQPEPATS